MCRPFPEPYRIRRAILQWWAEKRKKKISHSGHERGICESSIRVAVDVAVTLPTNPFFPTQSQDPAACDMSATALKFPLFTSHTLHPCVKSHPKSARD